MDHRPLDIALPGGHTHLAGAFLPVVHHPLPIDLHTVLQRGLHEVIHATAAELADGLRLPELDVLTELADPHLYFGVPGMAGGFDIVLEGGELAVSSWSRRAPSDPLRPARLRVGSSLAVHS